MRAKGSDYIRCIVTAVCIVSIVIALQQGRGLVLWQSLSDGCFAAAVFLMGFGGLRMAANAGVFDLPSYGIRRLFEAHRRRDAEREDFLSYCNRRRKSAKSPRPWLVTGGCFLLFSFVFLWILRH
ncbi:MAG: DUF3899 domain-containing protein [Lachnospiraceae bacterium]|nr:DUF3899 domain-containing protein [Lachnospiraceae bacterium]